MPTPQYPVYSNDLRDQYRYQFNAVLKLEYPTMFTPLETIRPVFGEIKLPSGIVLGEAFGDTLETTLKEKPWLEAKFGLTRERITRIRTMLLDWYTAMRLPQENVWAEFALDMYPVAPELENATPHRDSLRPGQFLTTLWVPGWQTRTEYLKEAMERLQGYCDAVEASLNGDPNITVITGLETPNRNLTWVAWSQVEELSSSEIAARWDARSGRIFDPGMVRKALSKTRGILGL
jgi:hypothetical protein